MVAGKNREEELGFQPPLKGTLQWPNFHQAQFLKAVPSLETPQTDSEAFNTWVCKAHLPTHSSPQVTVNIKRDIYVWKLRNYRKKLFRFEVKTKSNQGTAEHTHFPSTFYEWAS
jgi:hypothetical protein